MTAIWLLSTRGRPEACQEVLDACEEMKMTSPGVVYVDETVDEYRDIRLPSNWTIHYEPKWGSLQASMQWCFKKYPNATQYGWLADDTLPRTPEWDKQLEASAGDWCLSCARDMWLSESPFTEYELKIGNNLSSGLCWGGNLVRFAGWWALPGLRQAGIDTVWTAIISAAGLARYTPQVIVEHKNWRTGKRRKDEVDDWSRDGVGYIQDDINYRDKWVGSEEYRQLLRRLLKTVDVPKTEFQLHLLRQMVRDSHVREQWKPGMPAARMQAALNWVNENLENLVADVLRSNPDLGQTG